MTVHRPAHVGSRLISASMLAFLTFAGVQPLHGAGSAGPGFDGSVPAAKETPGVLPLSLSRAIELGLANNLGLLLENEAIRLARGQRLVELSRLLPNLSLSGSVHHQKESLAPTGISLPGVPAVVGPFNYFDTRITLSQTILDVAALKRTQAAGHEVEAARLTEKDARELVVLSVGAAYLQALADQARVATVRSQLVTAKTILDRAVELHKAGITPGIDELRARVEWLTRSQQLIVAENQFAKQKLGLLRVIGVPVGQAFELTDRAPFEPLAVGSLQEDISRGFVSRADYRAARNLLDAANASHRAAQAQRLPSLVLDADYGGTGVSLASMRETYHIVGSIRMPIFEGGRIHGEELRAEAQVRQREEELGDLRGRIEYEVRSAWLDVGAAAREVEVVTKAVELAELALNQAQERFSAGIDDNLAVIQAQQSVAAAHEGLVDSQYRYNLAKLLLAKAMGVAAEGTTGFTGGR